MRILTLGVNLPRCLHPWQTFDPGRPEIYMLTQNVNSSYDNSRPAIEVFMTKHQRTRRESLAILSPGLSAPGVVEGV